MKVRMTCSRPGLLAGLTYDLPDDEAQKLIDNEMAVPALVMKEDVETAPKRKKVKDADN